MHILLLRNKVLLKCIISCGRRHFSVSGPHKATLAGGSLLRSVIPSAAAKNHIGRSRSLGSSLAHSNRFSIGELILSLLSIRLLVMVMLRRDRSEGFAIHVSVLLYLVVLGAIDSRLLVRHRFCLLCFGGRLLVNGLTWTKNCLGSILDVSHDTCSQAVSL